LTLETESLKKLLLFSNIQSGPVAQLGRALVLYDPALGQPEVPSSKPARDEYLGRPTKILLMRMNYNEKIYARVFSEEEEFYDSLMEYKYKTIIDMIGASKKILDIGCGNGKLGELIKNELKDVEVYGVDISSNALKAAKKRGLITVKQNVDGKKLKFKDNTFDLVICGDIIEHVYNNFFLLKEIKRILKKGGRLIVSVPNVNAWYNRFLSLIGKMPCFLDSTEEDIQATPFFKNALGHIRAFNKDAIIKLLSEAGFKIKKIKGIGLNFKVKHNAIELKGYKIFATMLTKADSLLSKKASIASTILVEAEK